MAIGARLVLGFGSNVLTAKRSDVLTIMSVTQPEQMAMARIEYCLCAPQRRRCLLVHMVGPRAGVRLPTCDTVELLVECPPWHTAPKAGKGNPVWTCPNQTIAAWRTVARGQPCFRNQ